MFGTHTSRCVFFSSEFYKNSYFSIETSEGSSFGNKGWPLYEDVEQLMPSGAKGINVYQGSLVVQQALEVDTLDVASEKYPFYLYID
jgi:hypothetical protein